MSHPTSLPPFGRYTIARGDSARGESRVAAHLAWCERLHRSRLAGCADAPAVELRAVETAPLAPRSVRRRMSSAELVGVALLLTSVLLAFVLASFDPSSAGAAPVAQAGPQARSAATPGAPA